MRPNHLEHNYNEECPLTKIDLTKNDCKVQEEQVEEVRQDIQLTEAVDTLVEVMDKAEEVRQEKRKRRIYPKKRRSSTKRTKEDINEELRRREFPLEMTSDYKGINKYADFRCLVIGCDHRWNEQATYVVNSLQGCEKCTGRIRLIKRSKKQINQELRDTNRFIEMISKYKGMQRKSKFRCLVEGCCCEWKTVPSAVMTGYCSGCPRCEGCEPLSYKIVDERLARLNIKRRGRFRGTQYPIDLECKICGYEWSCNASNVLQLKDSSGCARCHKQEPLTNAVVDRRINGKPYKRLEDIIDGLTPILWLCLNPKCNKEWTICPKNVLQGTGCPHCVTGTKFENYVKQLILDNFILDKISKKRYNIKDHRRYPDFTICRENKVNIIVEVNGRQHYMPVDFGGMSDILANENFREQVIRDKEVDDYFKYLNIPIIWIKYDMTDEEIISVLSNYLDLKN